MGVVLLSKKKTKDWLNVPVRAKPRTPLSPEKETVYEPVPVQIEETEEEEMPDDPVVIRGAKVNLLGLTICELLTNWNVQYFADARVADVIKKDPERDCRKYNIKARAREIFTALDVDKNGLVDEDEFIAGQFSSSIISKLLFLLLQAACWMMFSLIS